MAIFSTRRLCLMIENLSKQIDENKKKDLIRRLSSKDINCVLPAQAELVFLWAISEVADLIVEPQVPGANNRPDVISPDLFPSGRCAIEIHALSDDSFSGKIYMERTANIISNYASRLRKEAEQHLVFDFQYDTVGHGKPTRYIDGKFELNPKIERLLENWLKEKSRPPENPLRITDGNTDVVVKWVNNSPPHMRTDCRLPAAPYDLEDNPVYKSLKKKSRQLSEFKDYLRCIFMVDVGCYTLSSTLGRSPRTYDVGDIIRHAMNGPNIDLVCIFSSRRETPKIFDPRTNIFWKVTLFDRRSGVPQSEYNNLRELVAKLPKPRFEGYKARDVHTLTNAGYGAFDKFNTSYIVGRPLENKMEVKISRRLIHEYLAGLITSEEFQKVAFGGDKNVFEDEMRRGNVIQDISYQSCAPDSDDDYIVFQMGTDLSGALLKTGE